MLGTPQADLPSGAKYYAAQDLSSGEHVDAAETFLNISRPGKC
jgi:hypothetical protein